MDFIKNYKLEKEIDGYTLILYLNMGLTEFADEFGSRRDEQETNLDNFIQEIIKRNFPNIKINSVKLVVGTIVVATITLQSVDGLGVSNITEARPVFNMTYSYFETGDPLLQTLSNTGEFLDVVSPSYFDLNPDGSLKLTYQFNPNTIREMQRRDYKVVPFLSNHWDREIGRAALNNRKSLVKELVDVITRYNLDGINVDIENVSHEDRENYVLFVKELREALPKDKEVSVAIAANPKGYTLGWHGSYDNKKLEEYADYLMVMTYDEHYNGGKTGPVASIQFVEESIKRLLKEGVSPSKIVLGLPFFGRYWNDDGSIKGQGTSLVRINELINKYNGTVTYDSKTQSPSAIVNITGNEVGIPPGRYTIWFENEESILNKLKLIEKYDLKGAGSWSLHQATQNIWNVYHQWYNSSRVFVDVPEGWAKAPILAVSDRGWMIGTRDFYFEPNSPLTRAQAATLLVRILELERTNGNFPNFRDIPNNHWAKGDIEIASQHGLMNGKGNQVFEPDAFMTREEMATLLTRLLNVSTANNGRNPFKDIQPTRWSYPFVVAMAEEKVFEGFEDGTFRPQDKVTRSQMAVLLERIKDELPR